MKELRKSRNEPEVFFNHKIEKVRNKWVVQFEVYSQMQEERLSIPELFRFGFLLWTFLVAMELSYSLLVVIATRDGEKLV